MSSGKNPLMLMMALTMPGAAHALGLGDIHVDSALNERLVAQIDIVGATALELSDLRASVANRETFLRYGVDRPAFLTSAVFKVTEDSQGRPVLSVRSTEAFNEPVVNFLVDLHWQNGELVRQYTLLLDPANSPPGLARPTRSARQKRPRQPSRSPSPPFQPRMSKRPTSWPKPPFRHQIQSQRRSSRPSRPRHVQWISRARVPRAKPLISKLVPEPPCAASRGAWASAPRAICKE